MQIIQKIVAPTKQSHEPFLTVWVADLEEEKQIWIQNSQDIEKPKWERMGMMLERMSLDNDQEFDVYLKNIKEYHSNRLS